jgi:hypothetical protein
MLAAQISGNGIQILQLTVFIFVSPAPQKPKKGFLRQIFRYVSVMKAII